MTPEKLQQIRIDLDRARDYIRAHASVSDWERAGLPLASASAELWLEETEQRHLRGERRVA